MDKMREDFEAYFNYQTEGWAEYSRESSTWVGIDEISATALALLNVRWDAWKASRESLVVELPHMADYVNMLGQVDKCYSYLDDLHAAIHAAGIRTK